MLMRYSGKPKRHDNDRSLQSRARFQGVVRAWIGTEIGEICAVVRSPPPASSMAKSAITGSPRPRSTRPPIPSIQSVESNRIESNRSIVQLYVAKAPCLVIDNRRFVFLCSNYRQRGPTEEYRIKCKFESKSPSESKRRKELPAGAKSAG